MRHKCVVYCMYRVCVCVWAVSYRASYYTALHRLHDRLAQPTVFFSPINFQELLFSLYSPVRTVYPRTLCFSSHIINRLHIRSMMMNNARLARETILLLRSTLVQSSQFTSNSHYSIMSVRFYAHNISYIVTPTMSYYHFAHCSIAQPEKERTVT